MFGTVNLLTPTHRPLCNQVPKFRKLTEWKMILFQQNYEILKVTVLCKESYKRRVEEWEETLRTAGENSLRIFRMISQRGLGKRPCCRVRGAENFQSSFHREKFSKHWCYHCLGTVLIFLASLVKIIFRWVCTIIQFPMDLWVCRKEIRAVCHFFTRLSCKRVRGGPGEIA